MVWEYIRTIRVPLAKFIGYIVDSAFALGHPYFYLLRTNAKWSLCLLSGLSPIHYSSLLLELAADEKGDRTMIAWVKPREIAALYILSRAIQLGGASFSCLSNFLFVILL